MTHRRAFLKQLAAVAGMTQVSAMIAVDRALGREARDVASLLRAPRGFLELRDRYLLDPQVVYFNHGSIGTIPRSVHAAHLEYLRLCETNPWLYMWGGAWEETRELVREDAAALLGCETSEVVFTHNTTEGFNVLAHGLDLGAGDEVLFSSLNHDGASVCWFHLAKRRGFTVNRFAFPLDEAPGLTKDAVLAIYDRHITPRTRVLVFPHVDNMIGVRHPVRELAALARARGVEFVAVDGAQTVGMLDLAVGDLGVDFYCASPHKWLQAPKGLGLMYVRREARDRLAPMWVTWGQERWKGTARIFEDYGTRNLAEVITLGDAMGFQRALGHESKIARYRHLWSSFRDRAERSRAVIWRSPTEWDLGASLFALEVVGQKSTDVFQHLLHNHGFVFRAFATPELNTIRISPNLANTEEEMERFFDTVNSHQE